MKRNILSFIPLVAMLMPIQAATSAPYLEGRIAQVRHGEGRAALQEAQECLRPAGCEQMEAMCGANSDRAESIFRERSSAVYGSAEALHTPTHRYLLGIGVGEDKACARALLQEAAKKGSAPAAEQLKVL